MNNTIDQKLVAMHTRCINEVMSKDYYVGCFLNVVDYREFDDLEEVKSLTDHSRIVSFWDAFWYALPDSPAIHREPFNLISEICEYDYREYDVAYCLEKHFGVE